MKPSNSSRNEITRRDFMKTSALTIGAVTVLSRGTALAEVESYEEERIYGIIWKQYKWIRAEPLTITGIGGDKDAAELDFHKKLEEARPQGTGKSVQDGDSGSEDVTDMEPLSPPVLADTSNGNRRQATQTGTNPDEWTCTATFSKPTGFGEELKFRLYYYE